MRAGVLSDTHWRWYTSIPQPIIEAFKSVQIIFHAGDIGDLGFLRGLAEIAPVEAVAGNNETPVMAEILGFSKVISFANKKIGLTHGHLGKGKSTPIRARKAFKDVDIIIFGHSHVPYAKWVDGVFMLNPGSVSRPRTRSGRATIAILEIKGKVIRHKFITL